MKITRQTLHKLPALLLLCGAVVLMQKHAWAFWSQYDASFGPLWAIMLEGAALWLWSQRSIAKNTMALLASLLVLAGPLYQVSAPALEQYQQSTAAPALYAKREAGLLAQRDSLSASLATYNGNSQSRVGWAARIDTMNTELTRVNAELNALYVQQQQPLNMPWQSLAAVAMQAIALVIFQLLIVLCIRALSAPRSTVSEETTTITARSAGVKPRATAPRLRAAA